MPSQSQVSIQPPQTFSLCHPIGTRDGSLSKDSKMVNCFIETTENGSALVKRPGTSSVYAQPGTPQGTFNCNGRSYSIVGDVVKDIVSGTTVSIPAITTGGQTYYTVDDVPYGTTLIKSTSGLWKFAGNSDGSGGTFTKVTDTNYPATTAPGICELDGIIYVMDATTGYSGNVRGSALDDPTTWPALNFIQADFTLGIAKGLYRHLNYVVAYYDRGVQMYYDANAASGNTDEGTQLGPVTNASWTTGLASGDSVVEMTDLSFFLAQDSKLGRVFIMINGLEMQVISTPFVDKITELSDLSTVYSFGIRIVGHSFYVITLSDLNVTLVYDVAGNQWYEWTSVVNTVERAFVGCHYLNGQGKNYLQSTADGSLFQMLPNVYQDNGNPINVQAVTAIYDYGTINYKRIASLFLLGDNIDTSVTLDFSDDDYTTWEGAKVIDCSATRKMIQRAGRFRRRAYRMKHADNTPLRLVDGKLDVTVFSS